MESSSPSIFRSWINVLTQPGEEVFAQERKGPNATLSTALIWVVISAIVAAIFGVLSTMVGMSAMSGMLPMLESLDLPPEQRAMFEMFLQQSTGPAALITSFMSSLILTPIMFLAGAGFTHLVSKMFGGQGTFGGTAYLQSLFVVPINIVTALLSLVPVAGGCIGFILGLYGVVLWFFSTKTEHGLTTGKTIGVALVAGFILAVFLACIGTVMASVMAGAMGVMPQ